MFFATKDYWIRENVLKLIFDELVQKWALEEDKANQISCTTGYNPPIKFTYKNLKKLIDKYGKSNSQIAKEVYEFCSNDYHKGNTLTFKQRKEYQLYDEFKPEFYGYYSDYDWVCFCWLFGRMIDLPSGFPMYCIDLKQTLDDKAIKTYCNNGTLDSEKDLDKRVNYIKSMKNYPKQNNEHNALADAIFCKNLYNFLKEL